jgi:Ser/Thr protein kinase RdoA (MazF antagonist)
MKNSKVDTPEVLIKPEVRWSDIEDKLEQLIPVEGGFSQAKRGIVDIEEVGNVFVKIGTQEGTRKWANKEISVYRFLKEHNFAHIPGLLSTNADETAFALEALTAEKGWNWRDEWDVERLAKTLGVMDELADLVLSDKEKAMFSEACIGQDDNGWAQLLHSPEKQRVLNSKLCVLGREDIARGIDFSYDSDKSSKYIFSSDHLVHNDLRADNCAWHPDLRTVRVIDWNWLQMGDRPIDLAATLTHIQKSGFDLPADALSRLDAGALHWLAGFWFNSAATPIWEDGPEHLRSLQLLAGITALDLIEKC